MPLHLSGRTQAPPGGWLFKVDALSVRAPKLAWVGPFHTFGDLVGEVRKRCVANGLDVPDEAAIEDQICRRAGGGLCRDELGQPVVGARAGNFAVTAAAVVQGTKTLFSWWRNGSVSDNEVIRRTYICNACPENQPISGCRSCAMVDMHAVVNKIVVRPLPTDAMLHACAVCGCSLKAKVRMKIGDVLPHMSPEQVQRLPDKCWLVADAVPNEAAEILT